MPTRLVDLDELARRLAIRRSSRSEATLQADIRTFLLYGGLNLHDAQVVDLEVPTRDGTRRRIDIEVGFAVIEVKTDLRSVGVKERAIAQLAAYVSSQSLRLGQRYVGLLSDGADWFLYHLGAGGVLSEVSQFRLSPTDPDVDGLRVWLEGILTTVSGITPTAQEIDRRLGSTSPAYALDFASLMDLYESCKDRPEVQLKKELWAKLLRVAFGTKFEEQDWLFVSHTYLVIASEVIAHAVMNLQPATLRPASIVSGQAFATAQVYGVVEADFFDWVLDAPGGHEFVASLARRLCRFNWHDVDHDVLKTLYQSVISAEQRHSLGEYYTPDWLAGSMVEETFTSPLGQRLLDPACGSGTFLFHAVRKFLTEADRAGLSVADKLDRLTRQIVGVDVHPVAVTLARVTYLMAIGTSLITSSERGPLSIPVYLGDTLQADQSTGTLSSGALVIQTADDRALFEDELVFPERVVDDAARFDQLVSVLADRAAARADASVPSLRPIFRRFAIRPEDEEQLTRTFAAMCHLHDMGRDHIWGYYVRNLVRPVWLSRSENKVDVLIGNPPWLAYRYMPALMQKQFKAQSQARGLWSGGRMSTQQDLSAYFLVRCVELYLKPGGHVAFVMPNAVLSRSSYDGFRTGFWPSPASGDVAVQFDTSWDLHRVEPDIFPMPAAVVFGRHSPDRPLAMSPDVLEWHGRVPALTADWRMSVQRLLKEPATIGVIGERTSPYASRFANGATVYPRLLLVVEDAPAGPLGVGAGRRAVRSARRKIAHPPWSELPPLEGVIEAQFIRPLLLGESLVPYRAAAPLLGVIPWDGRTLLDENNRNLDAYPDLAKWWRQAADLWSAHRTTTSKLSLLEQLDYQHKLSNQFPTPAHRVAYTKSGRSLVSARVEDTAAIIENTLYWAACESANEARYLVGILNSAVLLARVRPLQSKGAFGERDFHKHVFQIGIPTFDEDVETHRELVVLTTHAENIAQDVPLDPVWPFQRARKAVTAVLVDAGIASKIESVVDAILPRL
ncbi:MAG: N-6 DNA methylase [Actinomycetes bacterium]